ncbi:MAG TPA: hypothetical protein VJH33_03990 [Candidatus Paceibacterota bacterium]
MTIRTIATTVLFWCFGILFFTLSVVHAQGGAGLLQNPLNQTFSSIPSFIAGVLRVIVMVALPLITLAFVYAGFLFVKAQGNSGKLDDAKRNFLYVVMGAILILGAWVLATLIGGTVSQLVR